MTEKNNCSRFIDESLFQDRLNETIQTAAWQIAKIHLQICREHNAEHKDPCTVYTTFNGEYQARFAFCAERTLMKEIAENMIEEPVDDSEEIAEFMKEFINILCGHIVASIFHHTKAKARFHPPCFTEGIYFPHESEEMKKTCYQTGYSQKPSCCCMIGSPQ